MLAGRVYRIFQRYADVHVAIDQVARPVLRAPVQRDAVVQVEPFRVRSNRLLLTVIGSADAVEVQVNRTVAQADVTRNEAGLSVYSVDIPLEIGPIIVRTQIAGDTQETVFSAVSTSRLAIARARLAVRFVGQLVGLVPHIYRWKVQGNLAGREIVKERLGLVPRPTARPLDPKVLSGTVDATTQHGMATIVMPIFNAFDLLPEVLDRIERHSGTHWRLILVEDCSTDDRVRPFLATWATNPSRSDRVHLRPMEENGGFVRAANEGLKQAQTWPDDPVILLNSDAFVPAGWLGRMLAHLNEPSVASVTPMSNDAEIFSVPILCQRTDLTDGVVDDLDAVAAKLDPVSAQCDVPTGVGFCMAMAPAFVRQVPLFDLAFGRGYGEENDWCQKTRQLGGRHVAAGNVFVEHRGGASFGSAAKQRLLELNIAKIAKRYPSYEAEVQRFIQDDPLGTVRLTLGLAWACAQQESAVPVFLAHALGGGAEIDLQRRIANLTQSGQSAVVIRVGLRRRWRVELYTAGGVSLGECDDTQTLMALIERLPKRHIIYSCGVGDPDPVALPTILAQLAGGGVHPIDVLMHDFYPVSPSYTLLGPDARYHGIPTGDGPLTADPIHHHNGTNLAEWQAAWGALLQAAARIEVFSDSSAAIVATAYPSVRGAIDVVPHEVVRKPARIEAARTGEAGTVIGVLGNIGVQKGAAVVQTLSRDLAQSGAGKVVVIGHLDADYGLAAPSVVHGAYELRDLPGLVARYGVSCWLIPSIWPETFSFTTHEALATGMPVFAFDIGAQGDAVAAAVGKGAPGAVLALPQSNVLDPASILNHSSVLRPDDASEERTP